MSIDTDLGAFKTQRVTELPELQATLYELIHEPTGASIMHVACDDEENLFCISLQTRPEKSDGVAHILEHTVLCGSKQYPVRDPFFSMNRRSLNTFMNALTGSDFTCYPAASQVEADFYNLFAVYLDAVFHPSLQEESFWQEGHRLEFDPQGELHLKGIVFNEMKGALASVDARMNEALMAKLFPDLTYGVNSGGDPKEIPNLTYEELKRFHQAYYHPGRALFFFYGNLPLEKHLKFLEEKALKGVEKSSPLMPIAPQKRFKKCVKEVSFYPISPFEDLIDRTSVALSWLTCSILEQEELLALCVIDLVVMGTDASPLKLALLKSGLCKQADSFIEVELSEAPFIFILKGCANESGDAIEKLIRTELTTIAKEGLPDHLVEGAIHQLELARSEIGSNHYPFGLNLFMRAALLKQHGGNPEEALLIHTLFAKLRKKVKSGKYLSELIEKHLLNNPHFVQLEMRPDVNLAQKEELQERAKLDAIVTELSEKQKEKIEAEAKQLEDYQKAAEEQDLSVLPKVGLADVPNIAKEFPLEKLEKGNLTLYHHKCFTNDLVYVDLVFDLPEVTEEELPWLRLLAMVVPQMGSEGRTYVENLDYQMQHIGGLGIGLDLCLQADNPNRMRPSLSVRGKALGHKCDQFFPFLKQMVVSADLTDHARLEELLMQHFHSLEESVHQGSMRYAMNLAASGLSQGGHILNLWFGLKYYQAIRKIMQRFEKDPKGVIDTLVDLKERCLGLNKADCVISTDSHNYENLIKHNFYDLEEIMTKPYTPWKPDFKVEKPPSQGRIISSPVAFTAMSFPTLPFTHPDIAFLALASKIMENKVLHNRIREMGGAYGSGASQGLGSSIFTFYAYRDPHLNASLEAMHDAVAMVAQKDFSSEELEEAKLGLIQDLDSPVAPGSRGETSYLRQRTGRTHALRSAFRTAALNADAEALCQAIKKHIEPKLSEAVIASFAGQEFFEKENSKLTTPLPLYSVEAEK